MDHPPCVPCARSLSSVLYTDSSSYVYTLGGASGALAVDGGAPFRPTRSRARSILPKPVPAPDHARLRKMMLAAPSSRGRGPGGAACHGAARSLSPRDAANRHISREGEDHAATTRGDRVPAPARLWIPGASGRDRKSTRLNSSHVKI